MPVRRVFIFVLAIAIVGYVAYGAFYYVSQDGIIFPAEDAPTYEGVREAYPEIREFWPEADGVRVEAWYLRPLFHDSPLDEYDPAEDTRGPAPLLVVAHGNATLIDLWPQQVDVVREAGWGVLLVEFPGYGRSPGQPGEDIITKLTVAAFDSVVAWGVADTSRVVGVGRSLGAGVIADFALERNTDALILVSSFTSVRAFAKDYWLPGFLVKHPFDVEAVLRAYDKPVMLVHATDDTKVPYSHSVRLSEVCATDTLVTRDTDGHDTLQGHWNEFWRETGLAFLARVIQ